MHGNLDFGNGLVAAWNQPCMETVYDIISCSQAKGVPLASNQVQYSLLYREPERNGVKKAIEDVGATLVAYSPLNQGLLTGQP